MNNIRMGAAHHLNFYKGHLIFETTYRQMLIDTGSPVSIGPKPYPFLGGWIKPVQNMSGITTETLTKFIGIKIDYLVGNDVLQKYYVRFELDSEVVIFGEYPIGAKDIILPMKMQNRIPSINTEISGQEMQAFFDTAAKINFLTKNDPLLETSAVVGQEDEFYPNDFGNFVTEVRIFPTIIGEETHNMQFGVLPDFLGNGIKMCGQRAILGTKLLYYYDVELAFPEDKIFLKRKSK